MLPASPSHTRCSAKYVSKLRTRSAMGGESFVAAARLIPLGLQGVRRGGCHRGDPPGTNATSVLRQLSAKASIIAPETAADPGDWGAPTRRRHSRSHRSNPWLTAATTLSLLIRARASHCSTICLWASPPCLGSFSSAFITADSASVYASKVFRTASAKFASFSMSVPLRAPNGHTEPVEEGCY